MSLHKDSAVSLSPALSARTPTRYSFKVQNNPPKHCIKNMKQIQKQSLRISDLLLLYRFEDLDNAFLTVGDIYAFEDLTVFSPSNFSNDLVLILIPEHQNNVLTK